MIKLDSFSTALKFLGSEMDSDELECIIANLIYQVIFFGCFFVSIVILEEDQRIHFPSETNACGQ